jgi:glutamate synthase domain-containing protein 2/glutamate synthase domain-containing protein 1/glutamate synthase domain-containing protein 3
MISDRRVQSLIQRYREHPGRGGCGVGAVVDLNGKASHDLVALSLRGLGCMEHRGGSIEDTGDGAGLLMSTDRDFFARFIQAGRHLPEGSQLAVGVFFFPHGERTNLPHWQREIDATLRRHGLTPLGWRHVPTDDRALGRGAFESRRDIWQVLIGEGMVRAEDLPRTLWRVKALLEQKIHDPYIASFSAKTVAYKALATGEQLRRFYLDLQDPTFRTEAVVFHRRYSTNTFSNWYLAQVFRTLCHNGEINTIKANRNSVLNLESELGMGPILMPQGSDSADMDRVVELFTSHGVSLLETITRLMPMAWRDLPRLPPEVTRYFQGVQRALGSLGAWEGPAALVAMDGNYVVAALDRMGLRPLRYMITRSGMAIFGSEIGAINIPFEDVLETGQLDPGEAVAVHMPDRKVLRANEILTRVVAETPINFAELSENRLRFLQRKGSKEPASGPTPDDSVLNLFGWTSERVRTVKYLAENAKEQITSMGNDRPLPIMSTLKPPVTKYFKQIVAVVTNPPLDPLREDGAFDLTVHLGSSPTANENVPEYQPLPAYKLPSPILSDEQFAVIRDAQGAESPTAMIFDCTFEDPGNGSATGARAISRRIAEVVEAAVNVVKRREAAVIILSDMACVDAPSGEHPRTPVPLVFMASALHNALVETGQRRHAGIVVASGEIQEGHDAAVLIANGATAVYPWLFYRVGAEHGSQENLSSALDETLKRVMSKMGICSVDGYRGSRLFEAVGLSSALVEHYLPGITSRIGGLELEDLYEDLRARRAMGKNLRRQPDLAVYRKEVWGELQTTARGHDPASYGRFLKLLAETPPVYLRDLLRLRASPTALSVDQVSSEQEIIAAVFRGAAMSHGALHRVAHRAIAAAFNAFGASSNCGEGGEDTRRDKDGPWAESRSRIRQVASGRFGVDARYLVHADEVSIKIGQGAKPGEGGMLPGTKVTEEVARIRKTQQGVTLISPPPHHDIYSIEDLAQLIYNLRQTNPRAKVSVKIPAVTDIGTIAVGIAKAGADIIDVSGFEGGTGAATSSAIEHAGLPLERALSETHQALVINNVRDKVRIRADGGLKSGFDIAVVMALGADEISLGTALMIAEQCIFCHGCANGLCPAGITTQNDLIARRLMTEKKGRAKDVELRDEEEERYEDAKSGVTRYLLALANDLRQKLAALGLSRPTDLVGRVDLLERKSANELTRTDPVRGDPEQMSQRVSKVDLSEILLDPSNGTRKTRAPIYRFHTDPTSELNSQICEDARTRTQLSYAIQNTDRAVGATLAGKLVLGDIATPPEGLKLKLTGYAGQGFGFACVEGMRMELEGFGNDTVAEAMGGGVVVLKPPRVLPAEQRGQMSVCGNAACYGATGGKLFVEGRAGQRVGVRNSGAHIVVEGAGKYAFEYMTGGVGVVLGTVGPVVGSGLTGGVVYLASEPNIQEKIHKNAKLVPMEDADRETLRGLIAQHAEETGSHRAESVLANWTEAQHRFVKVVPNA